MERAIAAHSSVLSGWSRLNPGALFFDFLSLHPLQEAISALRVLDVLSPHISSLGKNLALSLFTMMPTACWVTL